MMVPTSMLAIDPEAPGGPEVLMPVTRPVSPPGKGEVLIRVAAAGVNRPDIMQRQGAYPMPAGITSIPGLEIAGEIVALGAGTPPELLGQSVCALVAGGGYAEYCVAPAGQCLPIPEGLTRLEAAGLPETYFTVWSNLFDRARAQAGESVLIHGATSGIGVAAIQLARAFGLTVFATAGSDAKCDAARQLGAHVAINYRTEDFVAKLQQATSGRGVDIVIDMVGGDYVPRNLLCLAEEGRHVSIAFQHGSDVSLDLVQLMRRRLTLTGSTLRARSVEFKSQVAQSLLTRAWPLFAEGRLRPVIDSIFPLAEAAEAHRRLESGAHIGKVMLEVH